MCLRLLKTIDMTQSWYSAHRTHSRCWRPTAILSRYTTSRVPMTILSPSCASSTSGTRHKGSAAGGRASAAAAASAVVAARVRQQRRRVALGRAQRHGQRSRAPPPRRPPAPAAAAGATWSAARCRRAASRALRRVGQDVDARQHERVEGVRSGRAPPAHGVGLQRVGAGRGAAVAKEARQQQQQRGRVFAPARGKRASRLLRCLCAAAAAKRLVAVGADARSRRRPGLIQYVS